jgi:hypothetical protein
VQFSGLFVVAFKTPPDKGTDANDQPGDPEPENPRLKCKQVDEAKLFLLDASKAHQNMNHHNMNGHSHIDEHLPRLTADLRFTETDVVPDEIILASEADNNQAYGKGIVELGVWNLRGPCYIFSDGISTPLKVVWGNRDVNQKVPDDSNTNHSSDLAWAAELGKCGDAGKLASGFWNTSAYETRCVARFQLSSGRLRAMTTDRTTYTFKNPADGQEPATPYAQAFATALVLKMEKARTHRLLLGSGSEIKLIEPSTGAPYKLAQVSNYPVQPSRDEKQYGQEHFGAYYDLTDKGANDLDNVERYLPYRDQNAVGVYRPKCIFGQGYE